MPSEAIHLIRHPGRRQGSTGPIILDSRLRGNDVGEPERATDIPPSQALRWSFGGPLPARRWSYKTSIFQGFLRVLRNAVVLFNVLFYFF